ncbi:aspartyl-phosphate phosphatase Spo0E family protein [Domibacillus mangrovi]|uniref:Spo0E family sporulation regulatory protein-aspartic acid phosphatase n=1 Tax=Domibacillus mangrovi TaxID=1714354 RepID=A0A1Q5NZG7_9BACI|nr:aspartyl-phosphate phosphatase Spo0E family protein [Domibacillus mangrovi]OKL35351.1 hypothetical protein BLL40_15955 [Domibacillus mangrovi]
MYLKEILYLTKSIDEDRQVMYELAVNKVLSDPDVVKISQKIDRKIEIVQKIMRKACG